ncbi:MAG TPA: cohesin domain-containing protein [Anaerolineae bacterium]|nr:cohesin domain-containing protein [Anaerolineae bacterium]HPL28593.1 cohesin domain-containing protein [Anaerolineae bacterium]
MAARLGRWLGVALLAGLLAAPGAAAQGGALVRPAPALVEVGEGLTAAVQVRVEDVQGLYGYDIRLSFDPAAVQVVDADPSTPGVQVLPGDLLRLDLVARNTADNAAGTVWLAMAHLNPSPAVDGSGVACTVTLRGVAAGARSPLAVSYARLATRDGREIPATTQGAEVHVVGAAQAPATPTPAPPPPRPAFEQTAAAPTAPVGALCEAPSVGEPPQDPVGALREAPSVGEPPQNPVGALPEPPLQAVAAVGPGGLLLAGLLGAVLVGGMEAWRRRSRRSR